MNSKAVAIFCRIGNMGEFSFMQSIKGVFKNVPSICLNGIKLSEHLGQLLNQLGIDMKNEAEIDVMIFNTYGDNVNVTFGECKVIQALTNASKERIVKKISDSLEQAVRDLKVFLTLFPDLTNKDLDQINFKMISILPTTLSQQLDICSSCSKMIVFRNDMISNPKDIKSVSELIESDMAEPSSVLDQRTILSQKLGIENGVKPATGASLDLLKRLSARFVGLGSLFIPKKYGNKTYVGAIGWQLNKLQKDVPHKLEMALLLNPEQRRSFHSFNFAATGFYGVGKTTVLEVVIDRIIEDPLLDTKVIFVTWNESKELKEIMTKKFEKIKVEEQIPHLQEEDSLKVFNLQEVCTKYCVEPLQSGYMSWFSSFFLLDRSKVDVLNDLCKRLKGGWYN